MKTKSAPPENTDAYIRSFPKDVQVLLKQLRKTIQQAAPQANETIVYQMPTYQVNGKNLVHFAAYKSHIGFYPAPSGLQAFQRDIAKYKHSKGAVQFPLDKPLPLTLISKIVKFRMKENSKQVNANKTRIKKSISVSSAPKRTHSSH